MLAPKEMCYVNVITLFENESRTGGGGSEKSESKNCFRRNVLLLIVELFWPKSQFEVNVNYVQIYTVYEMNMCEKIRSGSLTLTFFLHFLLNPVKEKRKKKKG